MFIGQRADIEAEAVVFDAAKNAGGIEPQPPRQFRGAYSRQGNGDDKTGNRLGWQGTAAEECLAFCDGDRGGWKSQEIRSASSVARNFNASTGVHIMR